MWDQKMKCCEDVQSWRTKTSVWKSTFPFWTSFSNKKIPEAPNLPVSHNQPTTLEAETKEYQKLQAFSVFEAGSKKLLNSHKLPY